MLLTYALILCLIGSGVGILYGHFVLGSSSTWYESAAVVLFIALVIDVRLREIRDRLPPKN